LKVGDNVDKLEKLINTIMKECEQDGEPVTYEEAKEMAEVELKAKKNCKNFVQGDIRERAKPKRERKVDPDKVAIMSAIEKALFDECELISGNEQAIEIKYNEQFYTIKLIFNRNKNKAKSQ
jgi:hypothetical protein